NNIGVAGVAGNCRVMPVKVLNNTGEGTDFDVASGIQWAADNGARIINMSLGGPDYSQALSDAVNYAYGKNVLAVAAAGNDNQPNILYPAALPHVMAVGATDNQDARAGFSNYGDTLDLVAPGVNIFSTLWNDTYVYASGTSMATPHVAGVAALVLSLRPEYTADQVESILKTGCVDLGNPGWDPYYGCGRVDALASLEAATPGGGTVRGKVYLEGRTNRSGALVSVVGTPYKAVTGVDGTFVLTGLEQGTYDLRASKDGYLSRLCGNVEVGEGSVTDVYSPLLLLAGDFTLDNVVDIDDLSMIRKFYGTLPEDDYTKQVVDVNQDGEIGLIDLVYMARNYAKAGQ
ncbi:MAG: S8 family serine peptidase, partial [Firmicutes bacterium]|nr:S8 family serine peptidase [Bacillota bacterium]